MTPKLNNMRKYGKRQCGVAAVEFSLIAVVLFTFLLGIIEFGRFFYIFNTVQEVTRMAARDAVVSDFTSTQIDRIQREAIFRVGSTDEQALFFAPEITNLRVNINYLSEVAPRTVIASNLLPSDPTDNISACNDSTRSASCIRYVEVMVCVPSGNECNPVQYIPMMGLFSYLAMDIPASTVTMPAESMGFSI